MIENIPITDSVVMPQLGFGVWQIEDDKTTEVVQIALDAGYRHFDTAMIYHNERGVGAALKNSGVPRDELFITTKLWNSDQGDETVVRRGYEASLERLGLDYVDLYLIHWPAPAFDRYAESWRGLIKLYEEGRVRAIGVSNFHQEHLDRIIDETGVVPAVNQIELHPKFQQNELRAYNEKLGIRTEAWSPLGRGGALLNDPTLVEIATRHRCTAAQVIIAWHLQLGNIVIPKSENAGRIVENFAAAQIKLTAEDMDAIAQINDPENGRVGGNPDTTNYN